MILTETWKKYLQELADPENIDVSSFEIRDTLAPHIWNENQVIDTEIADRLYEIANNFFESLDLNWVKIVDVIITGSIAGYNWSKYSDIDVHILIDFNEVDENQELVEDYLRSERMRWNKNHNIFVKGYEVELYVQDANEDHVAPGIYSIIHDEWIKKPIKEEINVDWANVKKKAASLMEQIEDVYELFSDKKYEEAESAALRLKGKIRKFRQAGLEEAGLYSVENLAFKILRRTDYLQKLSSLRIMSYDRKMSIKD